MEEAYQIFDYLPIRFREEDEQEYIKFLWDSFLTNYEGEKYQFAFLAYHMMFMCFVYFNIWQIKSIREEDFEKIKLGFSDMVGEASTPFKFSEENESRIFDLLKYSCAGHNNIKGVIGNYKKLVKDRNEIAHANGSIPFRTENYLIGKIEEVIKYAGEIQGYNKQIIHECFENFLIISQVEDERQYTDINNQIDEVLIYDHYLSRKDLMFCLEYDISKLKDQPHYDEIENIFNKLKEDYEE